ncbi:MAG: hypothetical protein IT522_00710 [Burkholderiales bacterium]|nr:hypothetical protein [Burkholderiales bacterium]
MHRPAPGRYVKVTTAGEPFPGLRACAAAAGAAGRLVGRCVAALERGLKKLRGGLPLCTRLLCEMHKVLLTHPGGQGKTPGEVRRSQVWIGGTRPGNAVFVPPPAEAVPQLSMTPRNHGYLPRSEVKVAPRHARSS